MAHRAGMASKSATTEQGRIQNGKAGALHGIPKSGSNLSKETLRGLHIARSQLEQQNDNANRLRLVASSRLWHNIKQLFGRNIF